MADLEPCCNVSGRRCLCLPYDDPWLISAQILTIASVFFGWLHWSIFLISLVGLTLFQVLWCARMRSGALYAQVAIAGLTSVGHLLFAIYFLVVGKEKVWCDPFVFYFDDDDYTYTYPSWMNVTDDDDDWRQWPNRDYCYEKTWFAVGLVCALMWAVASMCMFWFVKSGRHAQWEAKHTSTEGDVEVQEAPPVVADAAPVVADAAVVETEKEDNV